MPAKGRLEQSLAALRKAREDPTSEASLRELRKALAGASAHAAASAAKIAGESETSALIPDLLSAFDRFMKPGSDPGCSAKAAAAEALYRLGHDDPDVFLRGVRHVQMEPVFGGRVDTAVDLRGACALGLVRMGYREVLVELADLLADPEPPARISAARAIAYRGSEDGAPLLRLRILAGDSEPRVTGECLAALLRIAPVRSLPFVVGFLDSPDPETAEAAALALGESRLEEAFEPLRSWSGRIRSVEGRRVALLAIALLRRDAALEYLLGLVRDGPPPLAAQAITALGIYKDDEALRKRVAEAAASRNEPRIAEAVASAFRS
jgi:HEAT repeat protein